MNRKRNYKSKRYKEWRTRVFERDNHTCQSCGKVGGYINADHILPWSLFPSERFKVSNGRTLCLKCHRATPTFGRKLKEWVKRKAEEAEDKK